eukprot:scaffold59462_cov47-Attheya_sp.AAC.1
MSQRSVHQAQAGLCSRCAPPRISYLLHGCNVQSVPFHIWRAAFEHLDKLDLGWTKLGWLDLGWTLVGPWLDLDGYGPYLL